jgi:(5-formylfuran-3-yl)methyl phosphate synthase
VRLLVSVRSGNEVPAALAGGADIIDAKEPRRGSLGPVSPVVLSEIVEAVPGACPLSIALGDVASALQVEDLIAALPLKPRTAPVYLKLGFASLASADAIAQLLRAAVVTGSRHVSRPFVIGVAYADAPHAGTAAVEAIFEAAVEAKCAGVLLDTYRKNGNGLFSFVSQDQLARWLGCARAAGLLSALAGSLAVSDIRRISTLNPDVIGVRGAACDGGRDGVVSQSRVAAIRSLIPSSSDFLQVAVRPMAPRVRETREPGAISGFLKKRKFLNLND